MGDWTGKKTLSLCILTIFLWLALWKLDFTGAMTTTMKIGLSVLLPIASATLLWFREPK